MIFSSCSLLPLKVFHSEQLVMRHSESSVLQLTPRKLDAVLSIDAVELDESICDEEVVPTSSLRAAISIVGFVFDVSPGGFRNINDDASTDLLPLLPDPGSPPAPAGRISEVSGIVVAVERELFCDFFFASLIARAIPFRQLFDTSAISPSAFSFSPTPGTFLRIVSFGVWVVLGARESSGEIRFVELGG